MPELLASVAITLCDYSGLGSRETHEQSSLKSQHSGGRCECLCELKASLVFKASSMSARIMSQKKFFSHTQKKTQNGNMPATTSYKQYHVK